MDGFAHFVSLTMYIELEGHMIAQNEGLNEAKKDFFSIFFGH